MSKRTLAIILVIIFAIASSVAYLLLRTEEPAINAPAVTEQTQTANITSSVEEAPSQNTGTYLTYSPAAFAEARGTRLLFFHAPWCPQCRALDADITENGVPNDVSILKIDYDSNQALRQKYGVTLQTTIVRVDENGDLVKKYVAYDEPTLQAVIDNLLP